MEDRIEIKEVQKGTVLADRLLKFVENCSWVEAKEHIADNIRNWVYQDWERIFVAVINGKIVGMTSIMETDYYPLPDIYPWVSGIFVSEEYRNHRISGMMIEAANEYALSIGFERTYIPSGFTGLYEKYGYQYVCDISNYGGGTDRLYVKELNETGIQKEPLLLKALQLFNLHPTSITPVPGHEGGRNQVYTIYPPDGKILVLRVSSLGDRSEKDYLAETDFIHFLAESGAPVADVLPSVGGRFVEKIEIDGRKSYLSLFTYADGILISDNGYRYREGAPLSEYFYNTGKTLGVIHRLSKIYKPSYRRMDYTDKYNRENIDRLIPDDFKPLKDAMAQRLHLFGLLPVSPDVYGLVHFDFSDGNYHIDMQTGKITVFDFDNCINCWYMFDLANLWTHGVGWCQFEKDANVRKRFMDSYFHEIVKGYRSETDVSEEMLTKLPLFIDMVLIENIIDEFECCARENKLPDPEDIEDAAACLIHDIPYAGFLS